jgi:uncharacterized SAM-binding protein YcdF (DUF218 family)
MSDDIPTAEAPCDPEPAAAVLPPWWLRWSRWRALGLVGAALAIYYLVNLLLVVQAGRTDEAAPVDAIVVLGAAQYDGRPSPQLAARLDHVVELWEQGLADRVMVTGGNQPGDRFTEASASRDYLVERGVPESAILAEDAGMNTYDSLAAAAEVLQAEGLERVLLVTDPFHAARTELIADEVGLDARSSPTRTSVVRGWESAKSHLKEAAGVSLGRIIGFRRLTSFTG